MKEVKLIKIFIASPGDVKDQRDEIESWIWDWNNNNTDSKKTVLMPIRWENNSTASYKINVNGQAVINEQIVKSSDILIAVFGNKIGTSTKNGKSGTVEEINTFYKEHSRGVGIFFIEDNSVPLEMMKERNIVEKYKKFLSDNNYGLYQKYSLKNILRFINKEADNLIQNSHSTSSSSLV